MIHFQNSGAASVQDKPAIFFDADGVLWQDVGSGSALGLSELPRSTIDVLRQIRESTSGACRLIVVTNQTCVARGLCSEKTLTDKLCDLLLTPQGVDSIYICVHHPSASVSNYRKVCTCRKPQPGMFLAASQIEKLVLASSVIIGDRITDLMAASRAGVRKMFLISHERSLQLNEMSPTQIRDNESIVFSVVNSLVEIDWPRQNLASVGN